MSKYPRATGARPDVRSDEDWVYRLAGAARIYDLPPYINNQEECTTIPDQGREGSCVGQTIKMAMEFLLWREQGRKLNLSARWAYQKAKEYDAYPGEDYNGSTLKGGLKALSKVGICTNQKWPYVENEIGVAEPHARRDAATRKDLIRYERLPNHNATRHAIHRYGFVVVTTGVHTGWVAPVDGKIRWGRNYTIDDYHAYMLVGYDENKGLYRLANWWSADWGEGGFAWFKYDDYLNNVVDSWAVSLKE